MTIKKTFFANHYAQLAFAMAAIGGLLSDAFLGQYGYWASILIAFVLLIIAVEQEIRSTKFYNNATIPIPIIISVEDTTSLDTIFISITNEIEKNIQFSDLENKLDLYFNITRDMLMFKYSGSIYDQQRLLSFLQIIRYQLSFIEKRLSNKVQFHIAYLRKPSIGFALGGMFRADGIVVYQNNDFKNGFDKVAMINSRQYKEQIKEFEKFDIVESFNGNDDDQLLITIQISSHKVSSENESVSNYKNIISIRSKGNGTIALDEDWVRYAQEIYNVINNVQSKYSHIKIIHSMPEAVAIILGMALENYWNIVITQYDNNTYQEVINLKQIQYYSFEH